MKLNWILCCRTSRGLSMTIGTGNPGEGHVDDCPAHLSQLRTLVFHRAGLAERVLSSGFHHGCRSEWKRLCGWDLKSPVWTPTSFWLDWSGQGHWLSETLTRDSTIQLGMSIPTLMEHTLERANWEITLNSVSKLVSSQGSSEGSLKLYSQTSLSEIQIQWLGWVPGKWVFSKSCGDAYTQASLWNSLLFWVFNGDALKAKGVWLVSSTGAR